MKIFLLVITFGFVAWITFRIINVKIVQNNLCDGDKIVIEKVEGEHLLNFFYVDCIGAFLLRFLKHKVFSRLYGYWQKSFLSRRTINNFIKKHNIEISEYEIPSGGFSSFNEFFIRKLRPGSRAIDYRTNRIVSPADSKLLVVANLKGGDRFFVKSKPFLLKKFLQDSFLAKEYEGGTMLLFRLAPCDYHRFHFPLDCKPSRPKRIAGGLDSVNPIVYKTGNMPLVENERHIVFLSDTLFGDVIFMAIGALLVGKIKWTCEFEKEQKKGEEAGYFEFGGSSIVLLFKKNMINVDDRFIKNSSENLETVVKMGEKIGAKL